MPLLVIQHLRKWSFYLALNSRLAKKSLNCTTNWKVREKTHHAMIQRSNIFIRKRTSDSEAIRNFSRRRFRFFRRSSFSLSVFPLQFFLSFPIYFILHEFTPGYLCAECKCTTIIYVRGACVACIVISKVFIFSSSVHISGSNLIVCFLLLTASTCASIRMAFILSGVL